MNNAVRNPFRGISKAPMSFGGNYILEGKHLLVVKECKLIESSQKNTDMFVAEFYVIESNNSKMVPESTRSWVVNFQHPSALSNMKSFAVAGLNCTEDDIDEDMASALVHKDQPIRGVVLKCEANQVKTRKGGDFTKCLWEFAAESVEAYAAQTAAPEPGR